MNDGRWTLDPATAYSGFSARGSRGRVLVSGRFQRTCGSIAWAENGSGAVLLEVHSAGITTGSGIRDWQLCAPEFLDVRNYPLIPFRGDAFFHGPGRLDVDGKLTVRDLTTELHLDVGLEPFGTQIVATATTHIDFPSYGLWATPPTARPSIDHLVRGHLTHIPPEF